MLISGSYSGFNEANLKQNRCCTQIPAQNILNHLNRNTPLPPRRRRLRFLWI
jgi:hypothetical protein